MADKPNVEVVTLKRLCTELKIDAYEAREKLRYAMREPKKYPELAKAHKPRAAWEWPKDSPALKEARTAMTAKE
jgi:hypothetical protein